MVAAQQQDLVGQSVTVNLFDGQVSKAPGTVFGQGVNSKGDTVYLVEMGIDPEKGDFHVGKAQVKNGKCWVLSVYPGEIEEA